VKGPGGTPGGIKTRGREVSAVQRAQMTLQHMAWMRLEGIWLFRVKAVPLAVAEEGLQEACNGSKCNLIDAD
jgi:hypothetical protein